MLAAPESLMFSRVPVPLDELKELDFIFVVFFFGFYPVHEGIMRFDGVLLLVFLSKATILA